MVKSTRWVVVVIVLLILGIAAAAVVLRSRMRCAGFAGPGVIAADLPALAPGPGELRVATFNLRSFPLDESSGEDPGFSRLTNICDLEDALRGLGFHLAGFAEITDTRRFPPILKRATEPRDFAVRIAPRGGRSGQRVAIAWDRSVLEPVGEPRLLEGLEVDDDARPGLAVPLRPVGGGPAVTVVQVHLADGLAGLQARRRQHQALVGWLSMLDGEGVVVMGDFNVVGGEGVTPAEELDELDGALAAAGLARLENATGCTGYLDADPSEDGLWRPAELDLVYLRGVAAASPARSWLHCGRLECQPLAWGPGFEDGTFHDLSDHCPVTFALSLAGPV